MKMRVVHMSGGMTRLVLKHLLLLEEIKVQAILIGADPDKVIDRVKEVARTTCHTTESAFYDVVKYEMMQGCFHAY